MKLFSENESEFKLIFSSGLQIFVVLFLLNVCTVLLAMSMLTDFISFKYGLLKSIPHPQNICNNNALTSNCAEGGKVAKGRC